MTAQAGTVYRYFRVDADHDIHADTFELSLDAVTWVGGGSVTYITVLPAAVTAANTAHPVASGMTGYWYRALTGPSTDFPLIRGRNTVYGRLTDTPEQPYFDWKITVGTNE